MKKALFPMACAAIIASAPCLAANLTPDAPLAHFKGKDQELFEEALNTVLDGTQGASRRWSNPETKAGGEVRMIKSFTRENGVCRTVSITNKAEGRTSSQNYNFCKERGKWYLAE